MEYLSPFINDLATSSACDLPAGMLSERSSASFPVTDPIKPKIPKIADKNKVEKSI
jgi:hypothetical protein